MSELYSSLGWFHRLDNGPNKVVCLIDSYKHSDSRHACF
ncbi:hypothetical protein RSAG8_02689, partial [Rhizoctonia solani AG-8 WAC10335]